MAKGDIAGLLTVVTLFGLCACEDTTTTMRLLVYDKTSDAYKFDDVELTTIKDVGTLDGEATVLKGGLSIDIDYMDEKLEWNHLAHSVNFDAIEEDGVLIPENYDSLAMASIYYHIETAMLFFRDDLGLGSEVVKRLPTYYEPDVQVVNSAGKEKMIDSAFYMKISDEDRGFFILPFDQFQWVPMALNTGIIVHEYSHYIFDNLVLSYIPILDSVGNNFLISVNEGVADFFAAVCTGDPDFMAHSIPQGLFETAVCNSTANMEISRDISNPGRRDYNQVMDYWARATTDPNEYCPYEIGLFFGSLLYEIAGAIDGDDLTAKPSRQALFQVSAWLLGALADLREQLRLTATFEISDIFTIFIANVDSDEERTTVCQIIAERFSVYFSEVQGC